MGIQDQVMLPMDPIDEAQQEKRDAVGSFGVETLDPVLLADLAHEFQVAVGSQGQLCGIHDHVKVSMELSSWSSSRGTSRSWCSSASSQ